jgi:hypothetical protein
MSLRSLPLLAVLAALPATSTRANEPSSVHPNGPDAVDRLQLDSTAVTGNRELPKVMSIVPWKPPEPPDGPERPMGSLIEEVLAPLDRDEFRREITYFRDLSSQSTATGVVPAGPSAAAAVPESSRTASSAAPGASKR